MGSVARLGEAVLKGLEEALPGLRETVSRKLALVVGSMLEAGTANTAALANLLPIETSRSDMRQQWLTRLLRNPLLSKEEVMGPFAIKALEKAAEQGQRILLSMDQTELGDRFAVLMVSVRVGDRALPLAWVCEPGKANIGFSGQKALLSLVNSWLPEGASRPIMLADRFYPSKSLLVWLKNAGWSYRLRLKGNLSVACGDPSISKTRDLVQAGVERYQPGVLLFDDEEPTNIGVLWDEGHKEPWIIAMDATPNRASTMDYAARWSIEPMFSDFKSRGFGLEATQLKHADRLERLILVMALALHWCVEVGRREAQNHPTPTEKKPNIS
jgi:Transposase DDE domain